VIVLPVLATCGAARTVVGLIAVEAFAAAYDLVRDELLASQEKILPTKEFAGWSDWKLAQAAPS
jgi:hypothetical protein